MNNKNEKIKVTKLNEITTGEFTIVDLVKINSNVKAPTVRMHVKRNVDSGRYTVTGVRKTGKRGKPSMTYTLSNTAKVDNVVA